jgi:hypothetical protein
MVYYKDMSAYWYIDVGMARRGRSPSLNVGWLAAGFEFPQAEPSEALLDRLWQYCKISIALRRGIHECDLCSADGHHAEHNGEILLLGMSEIRVFAPEGAVYAAPTLIYHYVKAHHYLPPAGFLAALYNGPCPPEPAFFERLEELELEWYDTLPQPPSADVLRRLGLPPRPPRPGS